MTNKPRKHAEVIKAWADGAEIEFWSLYHREWVQCPNPSWDCESKYRVKPMPHKWQKEIDAQAAGKIVQHRPGNIWIDPMPDHPWKFDGAGEYRIKPVKAHLRMRAAPDRVSGGKGASGGWKGDGGDNNLELVFVDDVLVSATVL